MSNGVEEPGKNHSVPSKWNAKSFLLGDYTCCDLVVKIKECKKSENSTTPPEVSPASPSPTLLKGPEAPGLSEDSPHPQETPANPLTLQVRPT